MSGSTGGAMGGSAGGSAGGRERESIDRGWFYVREPDDGAHTPADRLLRAGDGAALSRRLHGYDAAVMVEVALAEGDAAGVALAERGATARAEGAGGGALPIAPLLRAAGAAGRAAEARPGAPPLRVRLTTAGSPVAWVDGGLQLDRAAVCAAPAPHALEAAVAAALPPAWSAPTWPDAGPAPRPVRRLLAFESLLNTDMPHNDQELSQGVLHLLAPLAGQGVEVVLARVKMPIVGDERPPTGLEHLSAAALAGVELVLISLLEGYWHGAVQLIAHLRALGCRAHIAVGGVMPTLTPEHVAAHLPGVSFVARGAGEHFVPRLVALLGGATVDQPFTPAQQAALLADRGLIAIDRAGRRLIAARPSETVAVEDLDRVPLDLRYLEPRHVVGGIEITTSRGCVHRCSFCSIIGRERYQARSAEGVFELLASYEARFQQMFAPGPVPSGAYRVHIADDDFACEKGRAITFLQQLRQTRFRLSSVQVSVADLCLRDANKALLPEVDPDWIAALDPACFADQGRPIPRSARVRDHQHRDWSSYLQIGVETFSERELVRLGKGYRLAHVRAVVDALARRDLHHDAYFIQSNTDTTAEDLLESVIELCRLKLRYPVHFHLRFPVVPHLVSYFPTATYRKKARAGRLHTLRLIDQLAEPGFPELDYPLVDHDLPDDPLVAIAVREGFLTDAGYYTGSLVRLRALWQAAGAPEPLLRRLDDLPRQLVFELLRDTRTGEQGRVPEGWGSAPRAEDALAMAVELLGPRAGWLPAFQRSLTEGPDRLVVIPTWQCELRCTYCYIPKQDGRVMPLPVLDRAIDLLLSSRKPSLILQFFGGEALLEYPAIQHAILQTEARAKPLKKSVQFIISSNGWSLDDEKLAWLAGHNVKLELSLDGAPETQNRFRHARSPHEDSYANGIAPRAAAILNSGLPHDVIMVVHPLNAHKLAEGFFHIAGLGFQRIQINPALGPMWRPAHVEALSAGLQAIGEGLRARWAAGERLVLINAESRPMPVRLNAEVTVDHDGTIYGGNAFLHETEHKQRFVVGHLDDATGFSRAALDAPSNEELLRYSYPPDVTQNNLAVGKLMRSFCLYLRGEASR